ncbi:MAG: shikimate dehydrogenase, partial [Gemmatimonadaceae bacterium]
MRHPSRLVLLGHPVAHSLSPLFQNAALRSASLRVTYETMDVAPDALERTLRSLRAERAAGNVTVPYKERVHALCEARTTMADRVGAVNTFWFDDRGALSGDNTDVAGFAAMALGVVDAARPQRIALLGAGGAAAAVLAALDGLAVLALS